MRARGRAAVWFLSLSLPYFFFKPAVNPGTADLPRTWSVWKRAYGGFKRVRLSRSSGHVRSENTLFETNARVHHHRGRHRRRSMSWRASWNERRISDGKDEKFTRYRDDATEGELTRSIGAGKDDGWRGTSRACNGAQRTGWFAHNFVPVVPKQPAKSECSRQRCQTVLLD